MALTALDWSILTVFLLFPLVIAARSAATAGQSLGQYFLAGRQIRWWGVAGSMRQMANDLVARTSADQPSADQPIERPDLRVPSDSASEAESHTGEQSVTPAAAE